MAQRTVVQLIDDLSGEHLEPGQGETVRLSLDGVSYELDLSPGNATKLRGDIAPYVGAARKVGGRGGGRAGRMTRSATAVDPRAVRAWAASNGVQISARGRVPSGVVDQYRAAGH